MDYGGGIRGVPENDRFYCASGSALRGYVDGISTYSEERGFPPAEAGFIKVKITGGVLESVEKVYL